MKKLLFMFTILVVSSGDAKATDYLIESGYFGDLGLINNDTLMMTGGWGDSISLSGYAVATIENTDLPIGITSITASSYSEVNIHGGSIGDIGTWADSSINMYGGNVSSIDVNSESKYYLYGGSVNNIVMQGGSESHLYGGEIGTLASDQLLDVEPWWPDAWIHIYCLEGYQYDDNTNLLTGQWGDGTDFNISLSDIGTFPTYDLIEFHIIPEPATISLLAAGFLGMYKKIIA